MSLKIIKVHPSDNVLVALQDIPAGASVQWHNQTYTLVESIPAKHKFFERNMQLGEEVYMYGVLIGKTTTAVLTGMRLSTQNLHHATGSYAYRAFHYQWTPPDISRFANATFMGYPRSNGAVGTANYWLFIPTVFCENRNLDVIKEALQYPLGYAVTDSYKRFAQHLVDAMQKGESIDNIEFSPSVPVQARIFPNVDGVKFLNHDGGCGGIRQDAAVLSKLLASYANHPNVGGITVLSLGCQNLQLADLIHDIKSRDPHFDKPLFVFEQQSSLSEQSLISEAIRQTFAGLIQINQQHRVPAPLSKLTLGVKCGGSDGFSGISANPAVGYTSDLLVALGGKVLLAEFPELCGVEQELIDRTNQPELAEKFTKLMKAYEQQVIQAGSGFHMNPSPGNIKDGLITDAMKSAGAARKGGTSPIVDVLDYTEPALKPGLSLVCTPGNDVEATTGKTAAGATLILFTTGLGTPTGNPICPVIKVSTNTNLSNRMKDIIDIDTGKIIEGECTIEQMGEAILAYCIQVASGEVVPKAVALQQDDFIPWKRGVSL
jgi:altronate hydrolase